MYTTNPIFATKKDLAEAVAKGEKIEIKATATFNRHGDSDPLTGTAGININGEQVAVSIFNGIITRVF